MTRVAVSLAVVVRDFRLAIRRLRRARTFALFAVTILALAIGATTSIYSLANTLLRPPSGVTTLDRLAVIDRLPPPSTPSAIGFSGPELRTLTERQTAFTRIAAWAWRPSAIVAHGQSEAADIEMVTGGYFDVLGLRVSLGRALGEADASPAADPVVVISDRLWKRLFGGSMDVIGQSLRVDGHFYSVVGVAPPEFSGLRNNGVLATAVWMPIEHSGFADLMTNPEYRILSVRGLLSPGRSLTSAQAEISGIADARDREDPIVLDAADGGPRNLPRRWTALAATSADAADPMREVTRVYAMVMVLLGLVLLVACANLANLTLARGEDRGRDIAVRTALGASRWSLIREGLVESACIAAGGGFAGALLARAGAWWFSRDFVDGSTVFHLTPVIDGGALALSAGACVLALVVVGLVPALRSTRRDVRTRLSGATNISTLRWTGRRWLVAAQVAVSVVFVLLAAWCTERLVKAERFDSGLDVAHMAYADVNFQLQGYDAAQAATAANRIVEGIAAAPGIEAAAASEGLPPSAGSRAWLRLDSAGKPGSASLFPSTPDFFRATGIRLIEGRPFDSRDVLAGSGPLVTILGEHLARTLFGTPHVVGRTLGVAFDDTIDLKTRFADATIVGVAADPEPFEGVASKTLLYVPLARRPAGNLTFTARTSGDPARAADTVRRVIHAVDPELAIQMSGAGESLTSIASQRVLTACAGVLGGFALIIALAGVYGVLAHVVSRRTREIGIRMALGAGRHTIWRMVLADGLRPVVLGVIAGGGLSTIGRGELRALLATLRGVPQPPPIDAAVLTTSAIAILLIGAAACVRPALRASRVDPSVILRDL